MLWLEETESATVGVAVWLGVVVGSAFVFVRLWDDSVELTESKAARPKVVTPRALTTFNIVWRQGGFGGWFGGFSARLGGN
jgi:hypothetical protein